MLLRIIKTYRDVVAVCDKELLGKRFEEGNFQLDVKKSFFGGEEIGENEAVRIMRLKAMEDSTFNIIGEKSVKAALIAGIISEEEIGKVDNIPFAIILI